MRHHHQSSRRERSCRQGSNRRASRQIKEQQQEAKGENSRFHRGVENYHVSYQSWYGSTRQLKKRSSDGISDTGWPSNTSASRPPSPPQGPMIRAQAKALHDKVNLLLNTLDLEHRLNGMLPHCNTFCAVRYEPHGTMTKGEEHEEEA
jgi:hypothetical protein